MYLWGSEFARLSPRQSGHYPGFHESGTILRRNGLDVNGELGKIEKPPPPRSYSTAVRPKETLRCGTPVTAIFIAD
jgi:hypothetical protein